MLGNFAFLLSVISFLKLTFAKKSFRNTIRVSNSLDPNQARRFVGPDLKPNCLQRLSADDKKTPLAGKELSPVRFSYILAFFLKLSKINLMLYVKSIDLHQLEHPHSLISICIGLLKVYSKRKESAPLKSKFFPFS